MDYSQIDFSPLWISLKTGIVASMVSFVLGILAAWFVVSRRGRTRGIWDGILTMPLVLPPTVAGYILLRIFSTRHSFGNFVDKGLSIMSYIHGLAVSLRLRLLHFLLCTEMPGRHLNR